MLRNLKSPETYFQAAFRVQSPWTVRTGSGTDQIMKYECYVFDFALDRALKQISDYSCRLNVSESNPEKKVAEFINFLPVLAYDGSSMKQIDAQDILDIAMAGTSATLLAKRWESALLVNVDNEKGQEGKGQGAHQGREKGNLRGRKRIQIHAEADSGETDQICYARTDIHVPDGFPRAEPL